MQTNNVKAFIEDSIKGGWFPAGCDADYSNATDYGLHVIWHRGDGEVADQHLYPAEEILLSPLAWQAVGKTRGWYTGIAPKHQSLFWKAHWHTFIDHLADGKNIEDALEAIS